MRTLLAIMLFMASNAVLAQSTFFIKNRPNPAHVVNDFGGFLSVSDEQTLENDLITYRKKSGKSIVIITIPSLTDNTGYTWTIEDAATRYFNKWGVGSRTLDNGVLILISKDPHRVRIATGKGVENILTDEVCRQIIDKAIVPEFKLSSYYSGLNEGVKDIKAALNSGKYTSRVYSGNTANSGADNWSSSNTPAQPQTLAQTEQQQSVAQSVAAPPKEISKTKKVLRAIVTPLIFILIVWLRVKWVIGLKQSVRDNEAQGSSTVVRHKATFMDYLSAIGWVFYLIIKFYWYLLVFAFGIFAILFGFNVWKRGGFRFFKYPGGRTAGASASYGGGQTNGGGATGSW
jgi:uncharacterized protein